MSEPADVATTEDAVEPSGEGQVHVVGTAHVSADSVEEVETTIDERRPDIVAVELDENRYRQMKGETPDDLDAGDLLHGKTIYQFLAYWMLSYIQMRLGERFDIKPGADMMAAVDTAEDLGLGVALVDRDIQTTIQRFWTRLTGFEKLKLFGGIVAGMGAPMTTGLTIAGMIGVLATVVLQGFGGPYLFGASGLFGVGVGSLTSILDSLGVFALVTLGLGVPLGVALQALGGEESYEELDMERLTDADVVTAMMEEFRRFSPGGAEALIDERDAFIAHKLVALREAGYDVVAIVGAGHEQGILHYLDHPEDLPEFESLVGETDSSRFSWYKLFGYAFTLGFLVLFVLLILGGAQMGFLLDVFLAWFLVNGLIAAGLAKLAGAHWTSAGVGGAIAWMTSLNPALAPGWFAGYVELRYVSVNVSDIQQLNEILSDEEAPIRDLYARMRDVPLFRLILVVAMTNIGSMIASLLFASVLLPRLSQQIGGLSGLTSLMIEGIQNGATLIVQALGAGFGLF